MLLKNQIKMSTGAKTTPTKTTFEIPIEHPKTLKEIDQLLAKLEQEKDDACLELAVLDDILTNPGFPEFEKEYPIEMYEVLNGQQKAAEKKYQEIGEHYRLLKKYRDDACCNRCLRVGRRNDASNYYILVE